MKAQPFNKFSARIFLLALLLGWVIWVTFDNRESSLRAAHGQLLAAQQTTWAQENVSRALAAKQKSVEMEKIYAQQASKAFGGPIDAAVKDPALNIRQMLTRLAMAAAPAGTEVSVTIDRFTEFDAALILRQPLSVRKMAGIARIFMKNGAPYVNGLRFIQGNEILAQLQAAAIDSVTNWGTVSVDSVEALLLTSNTENDPGTIAAASDSGTNQTGEGDLSADQKKFDYIRSLFKADFDEHVRLVQELAANLNHAAQLGSVQTRNQLKTQITSLDQLSSRLAYERQFFMHQSVDLEVLLKSQALDPLVVTIAKREVENRNRDEAVIFSRLFDSLSAYQNQIEDFLAAMESHWGEWMVEPGGRQIRFTTADAQSVYSFHMSSVQASAQEVQDNFRSWANHNPAK